ncbi:hypothetical protein C0992_012131 [Termitomyces sp. T32_za158]|nr:hypothetical protein C0992_012131 [Termitomyces sp. T32_za158]
MLSIIDEFEQNKFELPGIVSRGYASYSLSTSLVHSSRYNVRGLECYSYGFYATLLQDLVSDLTSTALVIPQFGLGALVIEVDKEISDNESIVTTSQKNTRQLFPDFAVVLMRAIFVDGGLPVTASAIHDKYVSWTDIRIERLSIGILAEAKKRPTRTALDVVKFAYCLDIRMSIAIKDLWRQAKATFAAYPGTDRVILIAFAGEWFSWKLVARGDYDIHQSNTEGNDRSAISSAQAEMTRSAIHVPQSDMPPDDIPNPSLSDRLPRRTTRNPNPVYRSSPSPEILESSMIPYNPNRNRGPHKPLRKPRKAVFKRYVPADLAATDSVRLNKPLTEKNWQHLNENGVSFEAIKGLKCSGVHWSGYTLFGTRESKESWFLIRKALEDQVTLLDKNTMLPNDFQLVCDMASACLDIPLILAVLLKAEFEGLDCDEVESVPASDDEDEIQIQQKAEALNDADNDDDIYL